MAQVTLRINGYSYTLGCMDGEEQHLEAMAVELGNRIDTVRLAAGPSGESRMLVMAALMMADDIFELRRQLETAQSNSAAFAAVGTDPKLGRKLNRMAKRAEEIAEGLEHP